MLKGGDMKMARIVSIHTDTDEHHQRDYSKAYFAFFEEARTWYRGAITYEKLFELLKPFLKPKRE
jgi:hypothetical protein